MNHLKFWLRLLVHREKQRPFRGEAKVGGRSPHALKLGFAPIVKDWMMTANGIKARELFTGKLSTCVLPCIIPLTGCSETCQSSLSSN
jgi:hypothetical protein